jgi:DNA-binding HxlR family transcriptional regulator
MLSRLLDLLREGGTRRVSDLAHDLDTTPELVETMLEDLARMGYVKRVAFQCSETCAACPMYDKGCRLSPPAAGGSSPGGDNGQMWVLVEEQEAT